MTITYKGVLYKVIQKLETGYMVTLRKERDAAFFADSVHFISNSEVFTIND